MRALVVANWKMNPPSFIEAKKLLETTRRAAEEAKGVTVVVAPPSIYLRDIRAAYKGRKLLFAAQHAHAQKEGSYTGEVSLAQVKDSKATHVIIGHAERRALGETNDDTRDKLAAAIGEGLTPILCIGETARTTEGGFFLFVREQLRAALATLPAAKVGRIIVAYEPVWAIGSDRSMQPRDMHEMAIFIRKSIVEMHGPSGMNAKILYGGAIDDTNAGDMLEGGDVDGLLVGRASCDHRRFPALLQAIASI